MIIRDFYNTLRKEGLDVSLSDFEREIASAAGQDDIPDGTWEVPVHVEEEMREKYGLPEPDGMAYLDDEVDDDTEQDASAEPQAQVSQRMPPLDFTDRKPRFTLKSWDEVRRGTKVRKTDIAILGMAGAGKSAYLYVLGKMLQSQVKLGKWRVGYMSPEYRKFLDRVESRLPRWDKTRLEASEHFTLFTLIKYLPYPPFKRTIDFASFDYSGESWRIAFQPGAESDIDTQMHAEVINEIRQRTASAGGFIILLDAKLATESLYSAERMRRKRGEEGIWHSVMNQLMWLDNGGKAHGTQIRRPVAIAVNKGALLQV